jgi:hypothetical protein
METLITLYLLNGVAITVIRYRQIQLLQQWVKGELPYNVLLACKKHKILNVRKLNPRITIGKYPGLFKKED